MISYEKQRYEIQDEVNRFFRRRISVAPRALAALQGAYRNEWEPDQYFIESASIFEALLTVSPSALLSLFRIGVPVEKLFSSAKRDVGPAALAPNTLDWIFKGQGKRRCVTATHIWKTKTLTETDLLKAFLQTAYVGPRLWREMVELTRYTSGVGDILIDAGFIDEKAAEEKWDGEPGTYRARSIGAQQFRTIAERLDSIQAVDPSHDLFQFALWQDSKGTIHMRPFGVGALGRSSPEYLSDGQALIFREGILQPASSIATSLTEDVILLFEDMLNSKTCSESEFQRFFTTHPAFLAGVDYKRIHPQLVLLNEDDPNLVPDFFLEPIDTRFCDLLEIKLPYEELVTRLQNGTRARFRSVVSEAVAQLTEYRRYFESQQNRHLFHRRYGLHAYYPKMVLVIGRRHHFRDDVQRQELKNILPREMELWTYDDLLARAR